jgi:Kelch motif protein/galactose oxidase-like protein
VRTRITAKSLVPFLMFAVVCLSTASTGFAQGAFSARVIPDTAFPTWVNLIPSGGPPSARFLSSAVYDPISDDMTIFAGCESGFCFSDVWVLSNADGHSPATWIQLNPAGGPPSARGAPTTVFDPGTNGMVLFGGDPSEGNCFTDVNDVWVLTGANGFGTSAWAQLNPLGAPPSPRDGHSAVYDVTTNRMIVFGGNNGCPPLFNDVWVLSNANGLGGTPAWTQLAVTGTPPSPRKAQSAVYDPNTNRMIIFGGADQSNGLSDVWVLTDANGLAVGGSPHWVQLSPTGSPGTRFGHGAVYDSETNRMYVFSGVSGGPTNDVWVLSHANGLGGAPAWHQLTPVGGPPGVREYPTAVFYNPARHRMTIFSGTDGSIFYNDVWVLTDVK